jgi:Trehalase
VARPLDPSDHGLWDGAVRVLLGNWAGTYTVPSRTLYPHQWSWDSAFNAIGLAHIAPRRAQLELESLLGAAWSDGRVPHIVFHPSVSPGAYFPGRAFWRSRRASQAPLTPTSGLVQPPMHARAAWEVFRADPSPERGRSFLQRVYPRLAAQHTYLRRCRKMAGSGLVVIVHPWESGMDNSPAWDAALAAVPAGPPVPRMPIARRDLDHVLGAERPTETDYACYVRLAEDYRNHGYRDEEHLPSAAFAMVDPLFNAVLAWSEEALADIATELGTDAAGHRARAAQLSADLVAQHFDEPTGQFLAADARTGGLVHVRTVGGLVPLLLPGLSTHVVAGLVGAATGPVFRAGPLAPLASAEITGPAYEPARYWRGPAWINTSWLVWRGLLRHGRRHEAEQLRLGMLETVRGAGFREYFDARTGEGRGADNFSWTAALVLDLLAHRSAIDLTTTRLPRSADLPTSGQDAAFSG